MAKDKDCSPTNVVQNSHEMSFDMNCKGDGTTVGHMQVVFDNPEQMHGTMTMKSTAEGDSINVDMKIKGHYLGTSCGDVKPEAPKIIKY